MTGPGTTRSGRPAASTVTAAGSAGSPFSSRASAPTGRPSGSGPNGDGGAAASGTRDGPLPHGNGGSKGCAAYTGSKPPTDRQARYRPARGDPAARRES